ncbi:hydroxyacid dehydrogenase [Microvirga sp. KLBC 81]|uniref:D-2-hydroxyacid dehydrogenase family protein n=1 Tax=Microvirga sp. KLBC 81 TaxID=1862707 RepID=UPI000D510E45|nr:D-2-hydroxyacid dehydrogenase family protein [Microvirga sp. KLBC 81]PVE24903.1 hydroxyacid dehydrogenase [Microvirga sp. KLBC 81]
MRVAILDDYQASALKLADWGSIPNAVVVPFTDHVHEEKQLIDRLSEFEVVLRIRERTEFPRSTLERLPKLKLLLATGMRNARSIDLPAARDLGITVCTTEAYHQTTVEITWGLILMLMRRMSLEAASLRNGGWQLGLGLGLAGRTLGILGLGNMGQPVARIGQGFGMRVVAWSPNLTPERTAPHGVECVSKEELFANSDVITIHIPHSDTTEGIVSAADIARMKRSAFLINTSRPRLVDQSALLDALFHHRIAGAGLDVFDVEPLPLEHPYRYLQNVIATPHIGFVTEENYRLFFNQSIENLKAFLDGKPIRVIS